VGSKVDNRGVAGIFPLLANGSCFLESLEGLPVDDSRMLCLEKDRSFIIALTEMWAPNASEKNYQLQIIEPSCTLSTSQTASPS
jgi:hypothetical protein